MKLSAGVTLALVGWLVLVALAVPGMPSWKRGVLEAVIILTVLLAVASSRDVRSLVADAPRLQMAWVGALTAAWFFAQIRLLPRAGFPIVSWHMYADPRRSADIVTYRLRATACVGGARLVDTKEPLGGVGVSWTRLGHLQTGIERTAIGGDASGPVALLDSTMQAMLRGHNRRLPKDRWCQLDLERVRVTAGAVRDPLHPQIEVLRHARPD